MQTARIKPQGKGDEGDEEEHKNDGYKGPAFGVVVWNCITHRVYTSATDHDDESLGYARGGDVF